MSRENTVGTLYRRAPLIKPAPRGRSGDDLNVLDDVDDWLADGQDAVAMVAGLDIEVDLGVNAAKDVAVPLAAAARNVGLALNASEDAVALGRKTTELAIELVAELSLKAVELAVELVV